MWFSLSSSLERCQQWLGYLLFLGKHTPSKNANNFCRWHIRLWCFACSMVRKKCGKKEWRRKEVSWWARHTHTHELDSEPRRKIIRGRKNVLGGKTFISWHNVVTTIKDTPAAQQWEDFNLFQFFAILSLRWRGLAQAQQIPNHTAHLERKSLMRK